MTDEELNEVKRQLPGTRIAARANFEIACREFGRAFRETLIYRTLVRTLDWLAVRLSPRA